MNERCGPWCVEPSHELLLRILHTGDDVARAIGAGWIAAVDLDRLDGGTTSLLPRIYLRLRALGVEHREMSRLRGVHRYHWYRNQMQVNALHPLLQGFVRDGVDATPLGALALAPLLQQDWGTRPMPFPELLIAEAALPSAAASLAREGWEAVGRASDRLTGAYAMARSSQQFRSRDGFGVLLHWRLYDWGLRPRGCGTAAGRGDAVDLEGFRLAGLAPFELLLHACTLDPTRQPAPPSWIADAVALLCHGRVDWGRLTQRAAELRIGANAGRALELLARCSGQAVPPAVLASLQARDTGEDGMIARLHRPGAEIGPALYRLTRLLARRRSGGSQVVGRRDYLRDVWDLGQRGGLTREILRRARRGLGGADRR